MKRSGSHLKVNTQIENCDVFLFLVLDVRLVLKAFKGNAEKTLEWFLAGGEGLPPATDSDDDMPALLIDTDPPHAASPKSVSIENRIEQNKEAYTKLSHGEDDSDAEQAGGEDHTHPNRDNFVIRDDTDSTLEEKQRGQKMVLSDDDNNHVRILFTGECFPDIAVYSSD